MRCKYCDKRLEPHQYKWNEGLKEFQETCGGRCVLKDGYREVEDTGILDDDEGGVGNDLPVSEDAPIVLGKWVPEA